IRVQATYLLPAGTRSFAFPNAAVQAINPKVAGIFNIRQMGWTLGNGMIWLRPRPYSWFFFYRLNNPAPAPGEITEWSQYGQGADGTIYVDPVPAIDTTLLMDTACYPIPLVDDATPEAIPYPWTDCVPFFAAYYALLSAQSAARQDDANRMFQRYQEFQNRARKMSNADVLPFIYENSGNPVRNNQLGLSNGGGGGGP